MTNNNLHGLYIVTPDWDDTERLLSVTEQALQGGANIVQYRHKTASASLRKEQAQALQVLCRHYKKPFIINDHLDLFLELDADGLHVGGMDISVAQARTQIGAGKILGASCYGDLALAHNAVNSDASYIAFGGFYPSRIKKYAVTTAPEIVLDAGKEFQLPKVVIGGMSLENCVPLVQHGAEMVAVISGVYMADDPKRAAQQFAALFSL